MSDSGHIGDPEITNLKNFENSVQSVVDAFMLSVRLEHIDYPTECRHKQEARCAVEEFEKAVKCAEELILSLDNDAAEVLRKVYAEAKDSFNLAAVTYNRAVIKLDKRKVLYEKCNPLTRRFISPREKKKRNPWEQDDENRGHGDINFLTIGLAIVALFIMGGLLTTFGTGLSGNGGEAGVHKPRTTGWAFKLAGAAQGNRSMKMSADLMQSWASQKVDGGVISRFQLSPFKTGAFGPGLDSLSASLAGCARESYPGLAIALFPEKKRHSSGLKVDDRNGGSGKEQEWVNLSSVGNVNGICVKGSERSEERYGYCLREQSECEKISWMLIAESWKIDWGGVRNIGRKVLGVATFGIVGGGFDGGEMALLRGVGRCWKWGMRFMRSVAEVEISIGVNVNIDGWKGEGFWYEQKVRRKLEFYKLDTEEMGMVRDEWAIVARKFGKRVEAWLKSTKAGLCSGMTWFQWRKAARCG